VSRECPHRECRSRNARKSLLKDNGYGSLNEATVSRLIWMASSRPSGIGNGDINRSIAFAYTTEM
jgi:hypothetical protein